MTETMYRREIMELYSEKPNFGKLKDKTHKIKMKNPSCNDEIIIELKIKNDKIIDAKFHGTKCFISTISASVLLEKIKGMSLSGIKKLSKEDMDKFLGIKVIPTRISCELLPLEAIKKIK